MFSTHDFKQEEIESWLYCSPFVEGGLDEVEASLFCWLLSFSVKKKGTEDSENVMEELTWQVNLYFQML